MVIAEVRGVLFKSCPRSLSCLGLQWVFMILEAC